MAPPSMTVCTQAQLFLRRVRFRTHRMAFLGEIEKAFLNVSVAEKDRDVLRFLWVDDITKENPEIVVLRFARVVFGVSFQNLLRLFQGQSTLMI